MAGRSGPSCERAILADLPEDWNRGGRSLRAWTLWVENPGPTREDGRRPWEWPTQLSLGRTVLVGRGLVVSELKCSKNLALATDDGDRGASLIPCNSCCPEP